MSTVNIRLYDLFRKELKLSDEVARDFVATIAEEAAQDKTEIATKDFVKNEISQSKNELLKWFIGLFFALALMIIGLYIKK